MPDFIEIKACIASLVRMIERVALFVEEYDRRIRSVDISIAPPVSSLKYAISFPEVRSIDLLCKDALERRLPDYPEFAENWYVHDVKGLASPEEIHSDLSTKRVILEHALNLIQAKEIKEISFESHKPESLPKPYTKLAEPVASFFEDSEKGCENYDKNVFIMTRFQPGNDTLESLDRCIREHLSEHGLVGHRADDRCYPSDRNLWDNVCTYMFCCKYGIAILENILADEFNPNVALEYGFMRALGKPTLLLKEKRFKPRADILGTLWEEFDILNLEKSVSSAIDRWFNDLGI